MKRKITSFYYLNYPDRLPDDPRDAYSEMYVEVGGENASFNNFEQTYSFHVYTVEFLRKEVSIRGAITQRAAVIVDRFEDRTIEKALESILDRIELYGELVGGEHRPVVVPIPRADRKTDPPVQKPSAEQKPDISP